MKALLILLLAVSFSACSILESDTHSIDDVFTACKAAKEVGELAIETCSQLGEHLGQ